MDININDIKNGITFVLDGDIYQVLEFSHVKPGKGAAFVKMKIRNLRSGPTTEKSFNSGTKLEKAMIFLGCQKKNVINISNQPVHREPLLSLMSLIDISILYR